VLLDANVIYRRALRDYLLYAAEATLISVAWSRSVLDEAVGHLVANIDGFTEESGALLVDVMNEFFLLLR
jgi:uncharacterized protein (DUF2141 family)